MKKGIIVLITLVIVLVISTISNMAISSSSEKKLKEAYQNCVYIGNECMNTYHSGKGDKTIVIIPNVDVSVPFIEYRPMIDQLSLDYQVVLIEPFGKGLSDKTDKERTLSQIVSEIHSAVSLSNVEEPYIVMSFGYGSLYATSYVNQYAKEVDMLVAIEPVVPNQVTYKPYKAKSAMSGIVRTLGLARLSKFLMPEVLITSRYSNAFSKTQMDVMMEVSALNYGNATFVEESQNINNTMNELRGTKLPSSIPTLAFVSTYDVDMYEWWLPEMQAFFVESDTCKLNIVETYQYMHRTNYHDIAVYMQRFIDELNNEE